MITLNITSYCLIITKGHFHRTQVPLKDTSSLHDHIDHHYNPITTWFYHHFLNSLDPNLLIILFSRLLGYEGLEVINPEGGTDDAEVEAQRGKWKGEVLVLH